MASCDPTPTLTVFQIVTSTATFTSFTFSLQTQPDGSVSTASLPLIETSVITLVNQPSTLYASCSNSSSLTTTLPPQSSAPATDTSTTTHTRNITGLITNFPPPLSPAGPPRPTTTSTPTPTGILPTSVSQSQTSNFAPIVGGAVGSFCFLIGVVAIIWLGRKKFRKSKAVLDEKDIVFPYPVTRGSEQLDLANESRPYEPGSLGRSTQMTSPGISAVDSHDGRPDHQLP